MKLEFFIIRNKHTGWYLPPGIGRDGHGSWSPTSKDLEISWARIMERLNG